MDSQSKTPQEEKISGSQAPSSPEISTLISTRQKQLKNERESMSEAERQRQLKLEKTSTECIARVQKQTQSVINDLQSQNQYQSNQALEKIKSTASSMKEMQLKHQKKIEWMLWRIFPVGMILSAMLAAILTAQIITRS